MTWKNKIIFIIISILTIGIYPLLLFKSKNKNVNQLTKSTKIKININKFILILGGISNIEKSEYTNKKIKIFFKNIENIEIDKIKKQKYISGLFISSKYITLIMGDQSQIVSEYLNKQK